MLVPILQPSPQFETFWPCHHIPATDFFFLFFFNNFQFLFIFHLFYLYFSFISIGLLLFYRFILFIWTPYIHFMIIVHFLLSNFHHLILCRMSAFQSPLRVHGDNIYVRHSNLMLEVGTGVVWWPKIRTTCFCVLWRHQNYNFLCTFTVQDCCPLALSGSVCMLTCVYVRKTKTTLDASSFQFSFLWFKCYWKCFVMTKVVTLIILIHIAAILNYRAGKLDYLCIIL